MGTVWGAVFTDTEPFETDILAEIDDEILEQSWNYYPSADFGGGYLSYFWSDALITKLLDAESVKFTIPSTVGKYEFSFDVAGLRTYINSSGEVCAGN